MLQILKRVFFRNFRTFPGANLLYIDYQTIKNKEKYPPQKESSLLARKKAFPFFSKNMEMLFRNHRKGLVKTSKGVGQRNAGPQRSQEKMYSVLRQPPFNKASPSNHLKADFPGTSLQK